MLCALWTALGQVGAEAPSDDPQAVLLSGMPEVGGFQWSPDGTQIAYLSNESGTSQIHVLSVGDGLSRQLTRHTHPVWDPQWSPDGSHLLFLSDPGWQERNEVWEVRLRDGATSRILANGGAVVRNARWSRDASAILLETNAGGQFDLAIWSRNDPVLRPFFKESAVRSRGAVVAWTEVGGVPLRRRRVDCRRERRKARRVIAPGLGAGLRGLRWSPDGQSILFITDLHGDWDVGVYSVASDEWSLITSGPFEDLDASWSSDGRRVAFVSTQGFDKRLGIFDIASRKVDYISPEGSVASSPLWSPVDQVLAFLSSTPREPRQLWQFANGRHRPAYPAARARCHSSPRDAGAPRIRQPRGVTGAGAALQAGGLPARNPLSGDHGHPRRLRRSVGQRLRRDRPVPSSQGLRPVLSESERERRLRPNLRATERRRLGWRRHGRPPARARLSGGIAVRRPDAHRALGRQLRGISHLQPDHPGAGSVPGRHRARRHLRPALAGRRAPWLAGSPQQSIDGLSEGARRLARRERRLLS